MISGSVELLPGSLVRIVPRAYSLSRPNLSAHPAISRAMKGPDGQQFRSKQKDGLKEWRQRC